MADKTETLSVEQVAFQKATAERRAAFLAARAKDHNKRILDEIGGMTLSGVRLNKVGDDGAGMVVTFTPEEAADVVEAIAKVVAARG
jgi:hypothetical protein